MTRLHDLLLDPPLSSPAWRGLLMFTFMLHLLFVLLMLGTAILGVTAFIRDRWGRDDRFAGWDKQFLSLFFAHKSLAVVLGVAPLLLMQVGNTIPFITATSLFAGLWIIAFVLILVAFLLLEVLAERRERGRWRYLIPGVLGLACLLSVPGIFALMVVTTENPSAWHETFLRSALPPRLAVHWLLRVLHILGAAIVFGAAFQYLTLWREDSPRRRSMVNWIVAGLAVQVVVGVALYASLPRRPGTLINITLLVGVGAAVLLAWWSFRAAQHQQPVRALTLSLLLLTVLGAMLLTRQYAQDQVLLPVNAVLDRNRNAYRQAVAQFRDEALAEFDATRMVRYDHALVIWERSCQFCHGTVGNGAGDDAPLLRIPPENLTQLAITPLHLRQILLNGVDGTPMPRFSHYTAEELARLTAYLRTQIGLRTRPQPAPPVDDQAMLRAREVWASTCIACHGADGRGSDLGRTLRPSPPDLTQLSLNAQYDFDVLTNGYPGTLMPSFQTLPQSTRWALIHIVHGFYKPEGTPEKAR